MRLKPMNARLTGPELLELREALLDAFDQPNGLRNLLLFQLDRPLHKIALVVEGMSYPDLVDAVIRSAETKFWSAELVQAARATSPESVPLLTFAQRYDMAPQVEFVREPSSPLEAQIRAANSTLDPEEWRIVLSQLEARVCQIELPGRSGTGFLVGPSAVMTNYHVLEPVLTDAITPDRVIVRFDFKRRVDGSILSGTIRRLAVTDWRIDASPPSALDRQPDVPGELPNPDHLDYAVVRLEGRPGEERVNEGTNTNPEAPPRGWLSLPQGEYAFPSDTALHILQHPDERPLKLALDTSAILDVGQTGHGLNGNRTRVRYRTNTDRGSSGSPCFDANWNLIALHHSGDPNFAQLRKAEYNQGIPIARIRERLGDKVAQFAQ